MVVQFTDTGRGSADHDSGDVAPVAPALGKTEQKETSDVLRPEDNVSMTPKLLTSSDWQKVGIAIGGGAIVGLSTTVTPLIPLSAIALGTAAVVIQGIRSARG